MLSATFRGMFIGLLRVVWLWHAAWACYWQRPAARDTAADSDAPARLRHHTERAKDLDRRIAA